MLLRSTRSAPHLDSTAVVKSQHCWSERPALLVGATRTAGWSDPHCWFTAPALLSLRARTASDSDPRAGCSVSLAPSTDCRFPLAFSQESTFRGALTLPGPDDARRLWDHGRHWRRSSQCATEFTPRAMPPSDDVPQCLLVDVLGKHGAIFQNRAASPTRGNIAIRGGSGPRTLNTVNAAPVLCALAPASLGYARQ